MNVAERLNGVPQKQDHSRAERENTHVSFIQSNKELGWPQTGDRTFICAERETERERERMRDSKSE